jgi:TonB family protein
VLPFVQPLQVAPGGPELKLAAYDRNVASPAGAGPKTTALASGISVTPATASPTSSPATPGGFTLSSGATTVVAAVLVAGIAARLIWLLVGLFALGRLRRRSTPLAGISPVAELGMALAGAAADVRLSPAVRRPVTFGVFRPVVLLPAPYLSLGEQEQATVLCHELLHVRRHDWLQTVAEELVRALVWFHPAIWWLVGQIDLSREQLVDQEVVALTEHRQPYLNALVTLALTPAGPILRPASLFLGRAHLLQRVALLSREVRMSRARLVASLALVTFVLVCGGRLAVQAFPLVAADRVGSVTPPAAPPAPAAAVPSTKVPAPEPLASVSPSTVPGEPQVAVARPSSVTVAQRVEPFVPPSTLQPGEDAIILWPVTISTGGDVTNIRQVIGAGVTSFQLGSRTADGLQAMMAGVSADGVAPEFVDRARAAYDAVRAWRFEPLPAPMDSVIGFNFARTDQSGAETVPVRIGGNIPQPIRIKDVKPEYPPEAQGRGIQGIVILEMTIDGAGIPITACAVRPIQSLTLPAVKAALQWRYRPDPTYTRRLMTVTVNFTLASNNVSGVTSGVVGGVSGGVAGGVSGGVAGGVTGGIVGGLQGAPPPPPPPPPGMDEATWQAALNRQSSFGLPRDQWPQYVRVGGNIQQPTKTLDVKPVYPQIAQSARVQGVVICEVLIGTDGKVLAGSILRSIPLLDQAALDAVKQWVYTTTQLNGNPVAVVMTVTVNFTLQ